MADDRIILTRRRFIGASVSTVAMTMAGGIAKPYVSRAADRPLITHGLQSGDVGIDSGVVWARTDRPARMQVEISTTESFRNIRQGVFADALPESDFTAKLLVEDLPSGQDIFYRIRFQDLFSPTIVGEPMVGRFRTAPRDRRSISFVWSGDTGGPGMGHRREPRRHAHLRHHARNRPDFFIHSGDTIYADGPLVAERKLAERRALEQPRHRGKVEGRRDARRISRQLQIQPARQEPARFQRRDPDLRAMGRSRGHQQLVAGRAADARRARSARNTSRRTP